MLVDGKLGMSQHATRAVLSMAKRSRGMAAPLYLALILPHLQHCVWFWALLFKKDINRLKQTQWRASKLAGSTCPVRRGWETWAYSALPSDGFEGPNSRPQTPLPPPQHLQAGHQGDRACLLWVVQSRWIRGNGHKLKQGGSDYSEETLGTSGTSCLERLFSLHSWGFSRPWSTGVDQLDQLDQPLASWSELSAGLVLSRTLRLDELMRFLPIWLFLWSCESMIFIASLFLPWTFWN